MKISSIRSVKPDFLILIWQPGWIFEIERRSRDAPGLLNKFLVAIKYISFDHQGLQSEQGKNRFKGLEVYFFKAA